MGKYTPAEAAAIEDRTKIFVADKRVGTPAGGVETFLQRNRDKIAHDLRHRNRGAGLRDDQFDQMASVCQVYDLIRGLNLGYDSAFMRRVGGYLATAHGVLDGIDSKDRSFLSKRGVARARRDKVTGTDEYFWNVHLDTTRDLVEKAARLRTGEQEPQIWRTVNTDFYEKLRAGALDAGELTNLINEGLYLFRRTFVNTGIRAENSTLSL
ncbi:MAG: hypothetical protein KKD18_01345 [Nanoarchaeota archaeon]|nr:hypothetical protein [Nanoarchaeota archaeon]MBU0977039.1 hypothetical protein [Nanoarchaeota archaeon]